MKAYAFKEYKEYLKSALATHGEKRGARSRLAKYLNCQTGYISQVLGGNTHFSLEHAIKINSFLKHDPEEANFFMLLVQKNRAGSVQLEEFFQEQIETVLAKRLEIKSLIKDDASLTKEDQIEYYSHWFYSAVHVLVSISSFQTKESILERLGLEIKTLNNVLKFLVKKNLILEEDENYTIGPTRIHLPKDSPLISKHHTNWRLESLKSLERNNKNDLHYSSVITLSKKDALRIKKIILNSIEESEKILRDSPEEEIYSMGFDLFKL